jgi:hypothetical protein
MVQAERSSLISDDLGARLGVVAKIPCRFKLLGRAGDHIFVPQPSTPPKLFKQQYRTSLPSNNSTLQMLTLTLTADLSG